MFLSKRFDELRDELRSDIADVKSDVGRVYTTLDSMAGDIEDIKTELTAHSAQHTRYDRHIKQLADHTDVELQYQP